MNATLTLGAPAQLRRPGMVWGVAVSVVLHLLLIFGYRLTAPKALPQLAPKETMTVWLMQPQRPAPAKVEPPPKPAQSARPIQQPARKQTEAPTKAATRLPAPAPAATPAEPATSAAENPSPQAITPPTPATPAPTPASNAPDPLYPPQQQQEQQQQQQRSRQFDINAALKTARKVANEKDPAPAGTAVAQLDDHPLYPEQNTNELATKIKGAKRESCLNQPGGNLLTPLFWLLQKKDHGCKL